jgi:PAS domain S-box-containing protein
LSGDDEIDTLRRGASDPVRAESPARPGANHPSESLMPKRADDAAARLAALVASSDDAIVSTTLDGTITSWNAAAERMSGYPASEAIGQSIRLVVPPERVDEVAAVLAQVRAGATVERFETVRRRKDGSVVAIALTATPIRDARGRVVGVSSIVRDIGERRRLDEAQARLAAIVDSSDDAIVSKTLEGVITSWNRAAERLFGYTATEAVGQPIYIIIPADRRAEEDMVLARIRAGDTVDHFETVRRRKDGTFVDISLTVSPVRDARGRVIGASKIARDISQRKRVERERAAMFEEAQQANRAKDEFLAMLGHELRNPLGAISSAIGLLEPIDALSDRAALARDVIARQSRHLARLVDDLLDVARVMTGKVLLERQPFDLADAVTRHVNSVRATGKLQDHEVVVQARPVWVEADGIRIEQIVGNLVSNAVKYTPAGGRITIQVGPGDGQAVLSIEDTGVGMPAHLLSRVFDLFVQGERRLDRTQGGLGIGLTLVRRLVELHGGTVQAFSEGLDRGSRFVVRLPAISSRAGSETSRRAAGWNVAARRILVIEDNADARTMLRHLLEAAGHEVHEAPDGRQGLALALALRPDVALIDLGLPGLDGYEIARQLRAVDDHRHILLVAVTGYGSPEDRERSLLAGFDVHLVKPVDPDTLAGVLARR